MVKNNLLDEELPLLDDEETIEKEIYFDDSDEESFEEWDDSDDESLFHEQNEKLHDSDEHLTF